MASQTLSAHDAGHPSPHRDRIRLVPLFFGLTGAPLAWNAQVLFAYGLTSYACYPGPVPRTTVVPGFGWVWPVVLVFNLICLGIGIWAGLVAWRNWQRTWEEQKGGSERLLETGEGRSRYISMCGILVSIGFVAALIFDICAVLIVPVCGRGGFVP